MVATMWSSLSTIVTVTRSGCRSLSRIRATLVGQLQTGEKIAGNGRRPVLWPAEITTP
jgi:hypothetical protein